MKRQLLLILLTLTLFFGCSEENPLETEDLRGTISGTVIDTSGNLLSGVNVATNGSHNDVTSANGTYEIPDVAAGTYTVSFTKAGYQDKTVIGVAIAKLGEVEDVSVSLVPAPTKMVRGTVTGAVDSVDHVTVTISNNEDTTTQVYDADWFPSETTGEYNISVEQPENGTLFSAEVKLYADSSRVIGYGKEEFRTTANEVPIAQFDVENAKPQILNIEYARELTSGEDISINISCSDLYGKITQKEYKTSDLFIVCKDSFSFAIADTIAPRYDVLLRVTDDHGSYADTTLQIRIGCVDTTFEGARSDLYSAQSTIDGDLILLGEYNENPRPWIAKIDDRGAEVWKKTFGNPLLRIWHSVSVSVLATDDNGCLLVGADRPSNSIEKSDARITKIDANGLEVWSKDFGGIGEDGFSSIAATDDDCFVIAGWKSGVDSTVYWVIKVDANGSEVWSNTFDSCYSTSQPSVVPVSDGGFVIVLFGGSKIIKIDKNGFEVWNKSLSVNGTGSRALLLAGVSSIVKTSDNGCIVAGNYEGSSWAVKLDENGSEVWSKTYGGTGRDGILGMTASNDGMFLLAGYTYISSKLTDRIIKIDGTGSEVWNKTYGKGETGIMSIIPTNRGGYFVVGQVNNYRGQDVISGGNLWVFTIDEDGNK